MLPPLAATRAMPLAQSWGEPPPKEMTQSQPLALSMARPASTLAMVGLDLVSSNTWLSMPCSASRAATRATTPI
ncbi:hypothetical protein D3C76_1709160 [compost metagenome]